MSKTIRSLVILFLICAIGLTYLPLTALATPETHPNTHVNTGDQRADIIAIALTQVGYREGPNNDTKYGVWYGYNNIAWCGIYVAWCANQAGVPTSVLARTGLANPAAYGLTTEPLGYVPLPGDLFFAFDHSHVGFVYYVDGDYFYSLEGNTTENGPEGVYIRRHRLSDVKFASPKYQGGGSHNYVLGSETNHPHKEYYKCTDCGDSYYTGKTTVRSDCTTCIQNNCSHSYSGFIKASDFQHSRTCGLCGKQETKDHSWNAGSVQQAATCSNAGSATQGCVDCGFQRTVYLPPTGEHNYTAWKYLDDTNHSRTCQNCGKQELLGHATGDYVTDEDHHWYECATCGQKVGEKKHDFGEECDSPCETCEYVRPEGHRYSTEKKYDTGDHWRACEVCGLVEGKEPHSYSSQCDETCEGCGYTRETEHQFENEFTTDENGHWYACTVCGEKKDYQSHTANEISRQGAMQHCTVCQMVLTSDTMHVHGYDEVYSDQDHHWGSCSCGLVLEKQLHTWSVRTEICTVCSQPMAQRQTDNSDLLPWAAGGAGILLVGSILLILLLRKKK